jgi:hypothetical protein
MNENKKPEDDEPILDLTEEVAEAPADSEELLDLIEEVDEPSADEVTDPGIIVDPLAETAEIHDDFDDDLLVDQDEDDFVDSLGMEIEDEAETPSEAEAVAGPEPTAGAGISGEQVDAALDRVIRTMFYDKIDRVLTEVIEKTVTREIERLKSILLEESSGQEK